jgi:S1-C subfamily serine protease
MKQKTPSRRAFLAASAGVLAAGVAGCSAAPGSDGDGAADGATGESNGDGADGTNDAEPANVETLAQSPDSPYVGAYRATVDSVARVRVYTETGVGGGTGWLYDEDHLVTNQHVVAGGTDFYVRFPEGGWVTSEVVGADLYSDLAVLEVDSTPESATPLTLREADPPVGTEVIAIGNPFERTGSVSSGIVSGVDRTLQLENNFSIPDAIQTDAAANPGNSGGPLVALDGDVVGVINSGEGNDVSFAISAALTRRVVPELLADGDYDHSYMGIRLVSVDPLLAQANDIEDGWGVYVSEVVSGSPSDGVLQGSTGSTTVDDVPGVETGGDVIVAMEDTPIPQQEALSTFLAIQTSPGDTIEITVLRDGSEQTVDLTLGSRPEP